MANCLLLLNDGSSNLLLNDGTSVLLLNDNSCVGVSEGGGGGSRVGKSKQVGVSIYDRDASIPSQKRNLKPIYPFEIRAGIIYPQEIFFEMRARFKMVQKPISFKVTVAKLKKIQQSVETFVRFKTPIYKEVFYLIKFKRPEIVGEWEAKFSYKKIIKLLESYLKLTESHIKTFDFEEDHKAWRILTEAVSPNKMAKLWNEMTIPQREKLLSKMKLDKILATDTYNKLPPNIKDIFESQSDDGLKNLLALALGGAALVFAINLLDSPIDATIADIRDMPEPVLPKAPGRDITDFTHPSSWIGHVIYDSDTQEMSITMSGKKYLFCGVDDRTFDAFEGSPSKGVYYWRILKDRFLC